MTSIPINTASPRRGRPRSDDVHQAILKAALTEVGRVGFRALTTDAIAAAAGVGKMALYRRWPNKAAIVMDAFMVLVGPKSIFPPAADPLLRIKLQMRLQAELFRSRHGRIIKTLVGEAQFDAELAAAFSERWLLPRRRMTATMLRETIAAGALRADLDVEQAIDALYAPLYYRLQLQTGPLDEAFVDGLFDTVMRGLATRG